MIRQNKWNFISLLILTPLLLFFCYQTFAYKAVTNRLVSSSFTSMSDSLDHVNVHQYLFPKGAAIRYEYFLRSGLKLNCHSVVSSTITQEEQSALNQSGDKEWLFCTSEIIGADGGNILVAVYDDNFSLDFLDRTIQIYQSGYSLHLGISIILVVFIGIISLPFFLFFMKKRGREHQKEKSGRTQHSQDFIKNDREAVLQRSFFSFGLIGTITFIPAFVSIFALKYRYFRVKRM